MEYNEMIAGLADEMLEKIAAEDDEYGYDDGYYEGEEGYYEDEDGYYGDEDGDYITEEDLEYMSDEELEALASAMYEEELEKTAGAKWDAVKAVPGRVGRAVKNYGSNMVAKEWRAKGKDVRAAKRAVKKAGDHPAVIDAVDPIAEARKGRNAARKKTLKAWGGTAAVGGAGYGAYRLKAKGQEKAAALYEEAQLYKQAAEEIFEESQMIQDAATLVFDYLDEE